MDWDSPKKSEIATTPLPPNLKRRRKREGVSTSNVMKLTHIDPLCRFEAYEMALQWI
jgi:hypothetical protein